MPWSNKELESEACHFLGQPAKVAHLNHADKQFLDENLTL